MNHVTLLPTICFGFDKINGMLLDANVLDAVTIFQCHTFLYRYILLSTYLIFILKNKKQRTKGKEPCTEDHGDSIVYCTSLSTKYNFQLG